MNYEIPYTIYIIDLIKAPKYVTGTRIKKNDEGYLKRKLYYKDYRVNYTIK